MEPSSLQLSGLGGNYYTMVSMLSETGSSGLVDSGFLAQGAQKTLPVPTAASALTALGPAKIWVGLKNSDDVGLRLDLLAEVFVGATKVGQGQLSNVAGGSSGFNNEILRTLALSLTGGAVPASSSAQLKMKVSVRRTCFGGGYVSGTARFWFNGQPIDRGASRNGGSRFDATIGTSTSN